MPHRPKKETETRERGGGRGGKREMEGMKKGNGEMVWILWIFGFYAFWALLWCAPSFGAPLAHRTTIRGYSDGCTCVLLGTFLSPKILSGWKAICEPILRKYTSRQRCPSHSAFLRFWRLRIRIFGIQRIVDRTRYLSFLLKLQIARDDNIFWYNCAHC